MIKTLILIFSIIVAGFLAKKFLFPSEDDLIRGRLAELESLLTKKKSESLIATAQKISEALDFFTAPVFVQLKGGNFESQQTLTEYDKNRIKESVSAIKLRYQWVNVIFKEISNEINGSEATTNANVRLEFETATEGLVYDVYPIVFGWKKTDDKWFITSVEVDFSYEEPNEP